MVYVRVGLWEQPGGDPACMGTVRHREVAAFKIRFDLAECRESGSISAGVQRLKRGWDMPDSRSSSVLKASPLPVTETTYKRGCVLRSRATSNQPQHARMTRHA